MRKVITTEQKPIKLWLDDIEEGALVQAKNLANLPFTFKHVAIMPDSHQGYGMPIGGVLATDGAIIPNAVGVDIGCGVQAVRTPWLGLSHAILQTIVDRIYETIPLGFSRRPTPIGREMMPTVYNWNSDEPVIKREYEKARFQLGTLGGGNHFIEIQQDQFGFVCVMVHTGSRNLGKQVADYYNRRAQQLNKWWHSTVPTAWDLAFLPTMADKDFSNYLEAVDFCVRFAKANRTRIINGVCMIMEKVIKHHVVDKSASIDVAHNYVRLEEHFGRNVWVHRKGATSAKKGETGIIPGSQGTASYIVRGLGNQDSFNSCSHGAGRALGRKQAQRELTLEKEQARLDNQKIIHRLQTVKDLDEAAGAYKDIDQVMAHQKDLVEIVRKLSPLAVVKG